MLSRFALSCYRGGGRCIETIIIIPGEPNKRLSCAGAGVNVGVRTMVRTSLRQPPGQNLRQVVQRWQSTATAEIGSSAQVRPGLKERAGF